ncbi:LPS-assembly protein LptD [Deferribacter autotrophicus]|uniref:LPS-assembly protein LptD n=1 Tax=Deferribacter autotrophicus TaxID=500465 RepID=A0A5A8F7V3_9BACT|nr:LPS-assembly protein LptD [Deferribacter autotrophicus]KAA0258048.1 LPS-assembly protein LptD [Deferribacter autotrophicus]
MMNGFLRLLILSILLLNIILTPVFSKENVILEANKVTSIDKNTVVAEGDVILIYKAVLVTANKIIYRKDKNEIEAFDNITFKDDNNNYLTAQYLKLNLSTQKGIIKKAKGFYAPYHYFNASTIEKVGDKSFRLYEAEITACKEDNPDWSFKSKSAKIDYGEYFYSKSATANIKGFPMLYIPYFVWPIKEKRESGFLVPDIGVSSKTGFFITPKYFWNIDADKDATFGISYFQKKGLLYNLELRYQKTDSEKFYFYGEYIKDKDITFIDDERWRLFSNTDIYLVKNLELRINLDYVSDFQYISDFETLSLNKVIKENKDNKFKTDLRLIYHTTYSDISLVYKDDMQFTDIYDGYNKEHLYRKPQIIFEKNNLDIKFFKIDYYADFNNLKSTTITNKINDEFYSTSTKLKREHLKINIYKPINIKIGTFTPKYTQYYTRWHDANFKFSGKDDNENIFLKLKTDNNSVERFIYSFRLKFELNEIYKNYKTFKHSIYNSFEYIQTPFLDQSSIPSLIEDDKIYEENIYKYTMTHYFKSKNWNLKIEFNENYNVVKNDERFEPFNYKIEFNYKELLKIYKNTNYDFYEKEPFYNKDYIKLTYDKFFISTELIFNKNITYDENTSWTNSIGYTYKKLEMSISLKKSGYREKLKYLSNDSLTTNELIVTGVYNSDCWSLGLQYHKKLNTDISSDSISSKYDHIFYLLISLKGIGDTTREIYKR